MTFSGDLNEQEIISFVKNELSKLCLHLKNRKTAVVPATKRQCVTGIVVNEKMNITKNYRKKVRQKVYYIRKFGLDGCLNKTGISDKEQYLLSLKGKIAFVLQTIPKDSEFLEYKKFLDSIRI